VINVITEVNDLPRYVSDPHNPPKYCTDSAGKNLTCFSFQPCFRIASQHLKNFDGFQIEYRIEAETFQKGGRVQYSRVKFQNANDPQNPSIITRQVAVTASSWNRALCDESMKQTVLIQDNTRDVLNPIWFKLTYTLLGEEPVLPRQGAPLPRINDYPILDQTNASKIFDVKFYKDCGENDICESDLRVTGALSLPTDSAGNYILSLGENNQIFLNFTLRNEHEAAYQTHLFVQHPATLDYIGSDKKQYACSHLKDIPQLIRCDIGNPFPRNGQVNISMRFNTTKLQPLDREVSVSLWANTTSTQNFSQSALNISANIVVRADIEVRGASDPLELFYSGVVTGASAMKRENDIGLSVNHTYEVGVFCQME
jgi:integrin alpha 7